MLWITRPENVLRVLVLLVIQIIIVFLSDLLRNIRTQVLIKLIKPYTRIQIPFISTELNIDVSEVENLLVSCILDKYVFCSVKIIMIIHFFVFFVVLLKDVLIK
jgi:hypothetical protein